MWRAVVGELSGQRTRTVAFDPASVSVRRAREVVKELCAEGAVGQETLDTVLLLTSELVTNAVLHGEGQAVLDGHVDPRRVRVTITDESPKLPQVRHTEGQLTEGGRGMLLVEELATRWGVDATTSGGKTVWFEVAQEQPG